MISGEPLAVSQGNTPNFFHMSNFHTTRACAGLALRAGGIEAKHIEAVGNEIDAIAFDRRRGANPDLLRDFADADGEAVDACGDVAGRGPPLPKPLARGGVETEEGPLLPSRPPT